MAIDPWLPNGFLLPGGAACGLARFEGDSWQIVEVSGERLALLAKEALVQRWESAGLVGVGAFGAFSFGASELRSFTGAKRQTLCPVQECRSPNSKSEALSFALSMRETRRLDADVPLQDTIYVETLSRLLPTYSISPKMPDEIVLGYWLSGGAPVPATSFRRLSQTLSWLERRHLKEVVEAAGIKVLDGDSAGSDVRVAASEPGSVPAPATTGGHFELAGRPELAAFFNEHVIDIVRNPERYRALGIGAPSAIVLHGPPGCGKTYAIERLTDFLGWPSFSVDASSIASPYIHETSKKVAAVFDTAIEAAPSVLVIDEMEAFLADREMGSGHHRVEEVAEFLRRIPEAVKAGVLIIGMTNRVDMIDPAILRRGRFDHVLKVDFATEDEVLGLIEALLAALPTEGAIDTRHFARELAGRPLSDVTFVIREGSRLAARAGRSTLDVASLERALAANPARGEGGQEKRRIGFV